MTKRAWVLLLALGLSLPIQGCGDDDESGDDDSNNNAGTGNAGRGSSGSGSGNSGSGSGNAGSGDVDDAIAECMAEDMMMGGSTTDCDGIEEYSDCVQDMCSVQDCMSRGCQAYFDCVADAEDPCMPTGCALPTGDCAACLADVGTCTLDNCFELIMCGETTAGGACDQLDDCCATNSMPMICQQAASGARAAGGDELCMTVMSAFCM
jgi:hypothetical protein